MAAKPLKPDEGENAAAPAAPKKETITLKHSVAYSGELAVGPDRYPVKDGVVSVPPWHVAAAEQAGFRPA